MDGYRSLTFVLFGAVVVAVAPSTTYRVLKDAGLIGRTIGKQLNKGAGFVQPIVPYEHWHMDLSYFNIGGKAVFETDVDWTFFMSRPAQVLPAVGAEGIWVRIFSGAGC